MATLLDKVAIVTGASSGIGYAAARLFAREGASVVITARTESNLQHVAHEITRSGGNVAALAGDAGDEEHARALVDLALQRFGGLDIGFNNVGSAGATGPLSGLTIEQWQDTLQVNLTSGFLAAKYQVPAMVERGGGSLIFTSSFVGYTVGMPGMAPYAASKAGLLGLVRALAAEYGPQGVRVNALLPGGTDTPSNMANAPGAGPQVRSFVSGMHALKRMATPEEIAQSALYLASNASSFVTGTALLADGGVSINRT
jgi:NAD(P)-dependent dehydrogenase (short-subunit alcohol dehydrogenase family)